MKASKVFYQTVVPTLILFKLSFWLVEGTAQNTAFGFLLANLQANLVNTFLPFLETNLLLYFSRYIPKSSVSLFSKLIKYISVSIIAFQDFIIVTVILFAAYLFHTAFTLSISSNFIFIILLIYAWV
jgi:hypothetical protein